MSHEDPFDGPVIVAIAYVRDSMREPRHQTLCRDRAANKQLRGKASASIRAQRSNEVERAKVC